MQKCCSNLFCNYIFGLIYVQMNLFQIISNYQSAYLSEKLQYISDSESFCCAKSIIVCNCGQKKKGELLFWPYFVMGIIRHWD